MNTWRDIKTDPPEIGVDVFATDGTDIFYGCFEKPTIFSGFDASGEDYIEGAASPEMLYLKKWQPVPDTWKHPEPEKTADEMFRELGYTWEGTPNGNGREYEGEIGDTVTVTRFGATFKDPGMEKGVRIGRDYILAAAQLIREMEEATTVCGEDGCRIVYPEDEDD